MIYNRIENQCVDDFHEFSFVENPFLIYENDSEELMKIRNSSKLKQIYEKKNLYEFWVACEDL